MEFKKSVLLTTDNVKTIKGEKKGYRTYIMYMSPFNDNSKGVNICPFASKGCAESCLVGSGLGGIYVGVRNGRRNKTERFLHDRVGFLAQLDKEVGLAIVRSIKQGIIPVFRLNGTSDISWEKFKIRDNKNIFELYPNVQFYDYTKNYLRFDKELPKNYHLTFSRSEDNHIKAMELLKRGINVSMVFNRVPETYNGYKVVSGDETDLRFKDDNGVIVGLKYKNLTGKGVDNSKGIKSGFVIDTIGDKLNSLNKSINKLGKSLEVTK